MYHHEGTRIRLTKERSRNHVTCSTLEIYADEVFRWIHRRLTLPVISQWIRTCMSKANVSLTALEESQVAFTMSEAVIAGITYSGHVHHDNGEGSKTGGPENG